LQNRSCVSKATPKKFLKVQQKER